MIYSSEDQWKNFDGHDNALGYKRVHILLDILEYHTYTIKSQNTYCFPNYKKYVGLVNKRNPNKILYNNANTLRSMLFHVLTTTWNNQ